MAAPLKSQPKMVGGLGNPGLGNPGFGGAGPFSKPIGSKPMGLGGQGPIKAADNSFTSGIKKQ